MAGIYIHIPFCNSKCLYCGFYSTVNKNYRERFIPSLLAEIRERRDFFTLGGSCIGVQDNLRKSSLDDESKIKTLYIGGGTPSVLQIDDLEQIIESLKENFNLNIGGDYRYTTVPNQDGRIIGGLQNQIEEFTIELNPEDVTEEYVKALKRFGVNRVSLGMQSFKDEHLAWMRRRSNAEKNISSYRLLKEEGIENVSIDLIFGFASLTEEDWKYNLNTAISLNPEHISAYQLSIDEGSFLSKQYSLGNYSHLNEEESLHQYSLLQDVLSHGGYIQYEVSNFAKEGFRSIHNSNYWKRVPYLGLGPSAHSFVGARREWNVANVKEYIEHYSNQMQVEKSLTQSFTSSNAEIREGENLSDKDIFNETIMLSLRTSEGISRESLDYLSDTISDKKSVEQIRANLDRFLERGILVAKEGKIIIPPEKLFVSDGIIKDLFL